MTLERLIEHYPIPGAVSPVRTGRPRRDNRAIADDGGAFNAYGTTMFWSPWGYRHDRARWEMNLQDARSADIEFLRKLGSVGPGGWSDRPINPTWPDYDAVIAADTDITYDTYGMRSWWTIFGGSDWTKTPQSRQDLVDRFARMWPGREHKVLGFEISNEGQAFNDNLEEIRALGRRLAAACPGAIVALTTSNGANMCRLYANCGVEAATMHYQRDFGADDVTLNGVTYHIRPIRQPWGYPGEYDKDCGGQIPLLVFNNEPIGIQSSGQMDDNPQDLAAAYVTTFIAQNGAYILHTGAGIRGGGIEDITPGKPYTPRAANFRDQPAWGRVTAAIKAARAVLPAGLANWTRINSQWSNCPYTGFAEADDAGKVVQTYHALQEPWVLSAVLGIRQPFTVAPKKAMVLQWLDMERFEVFQTATLGPGQPFTITPDHPMVLLRGQHV